MRKVASSILARGTKIFVAPGEHGFSFFQVKMFTGSVSVLLTSTSLKIFKKNLKKQMKKQKVVKIRAFELLVVQDSTLFRDPSGWY